MKQHPLVLALAHALVVLLVGCGKEKEASDGPVTDAGIEVAPADASDACAVGTTPAAICTQPLALSTCPKVWEDTAAPACTIDSVGFTVYTGPSNGYLVRSKMDRLIGGTVCFYDPVSKALVSQYQGGDLVLNCCSSTWSGPPLLSFNRAALLCSPTDGGATPVDAATD